MSRLLVSVAPLTLALVLSLNEDTKDKPPDKEKVAAHILLRADVLKEEQALQGLQTEWMLLVLKLQRRMEKQSNEPAKQEADACAKLVNGSRDLPGLYDSAVVRIKQSTLANIAGTKSAMKATGALADAVQRTWDGLKKAPQDPFAANRVIAAEEGALGQALLDAAADLERAADVLARPGQAEGMKPIAGLVRKSKDASLGALRTARQQVADLKQQGAPAAHQRFYAERLVAPVAAMVDEKEGRFAAIAITLGTLENGKKPDAEAAGKAQADMRACAEPLQAAGARIVIVVRLRELAARQLALHDRLRKHHDAMLGALLDGVEK